MWTNSISFLKLSHWFATVSKINFAHKNKICNLNVICLDNSWIFTLKNYKASTKGQIKHPDLSFHFKKSTNINKETMMSSY